MNNNDILFIDYIMGFADKVKLLHWAAPTHASHVVLDDFYRELESFKDDVAENIQSIIGQFDPSLFTSITVPTGSDPELIMNSIEKCINKWILVHESDMKYEGCRNACQDFLLTIHKYIYLIRLK